MELQLMFEQNAQKLAWHFINHHKNAVKAYGNEEDMFQELLMFAWKFNANYNQEKGSYSNWLITLYHYDLLNKIRRLKQKQVPFEILSLDELIFDTDGETFINNLVDENADLEKDLELKDFREFIQKRICPEAYEYYIKQKSVTDIAKEQGISKQAVSQKIRRNLKRIKVEVRNYERNRI